jgi:ubiquinone/menaquinone biosynthesis C-methylase UbiE
MTRRMRSRRSPNRTTSSARPSSDFSKLAPRYDELRHAEPELRAEVYALLAEAGDLRGRRVLDIGCGTGTLAAWLTDRAAARVWGVDPSPEMLAVARGKVPDGVGLKEGRAEALPFKDGWFERVVMMLVFHHVDGAAALEEIHRVLGEDGRLVIGTFAPAQFDDYYLAPFFPSIPLIDRARFETPDQVVALLEAAGFADIETHGLEQHVSLSRETVLARVRGKHISTFQLVAEGEYTEGLARAERELPASVESHVHWLVVSALRSAA